MSGPGLAYADRVQETSTTGGTGTLTLAGAVVGYQTFTSAFVTGQTVYYAMTDGKNWEVGSGTFTAAGPTLSRDHVFASSNAGAPVNFPGFLYVWDDEPAVSIADKALTAAFAMGTIAQ